MYPAVPRGPLLSVLRRGCDVWCVCVCLAPPLTLIDCSVVPTCVSSQTCVLFRAQTTNTDVLKCSRRLSQEGSPLPDTRNHAPKGPTHAIEVSQKKLCSAMISRCLSYSRVSLVARVNFPKAASLFTPSDTSWPCRTFPKLTFFGQEKITQGLHRTVEMIQPNLLTLCGGTVRHEWPLST